MLGVVVVHVSDDNGHDVFHFVVVVKFIVAVHGRFNDPADLSELLLPLISLMLEHRSLKVSFLDLLKAKGFMPCNLRSVMAAAAACFVSAMSMMPVMLGMMSMVAVALSRMPWENRCNWCCWCNGSNRSNRRNGSDGSHRDPRPDLSWNVHYFLIVMSSMVVMMMPVMVVVVMLFMGMLSRVNRLVPSTKSIHDFTTSFPRN